MNAAAPSATPSVLVCLSSGQAIEFASELTIGRHPHNALVLDHRSISSRHATVEWAGARWVLRDLGSRNGSTVNRRRVETSTPVKEGDVLRVAGVSRWRVERLGIPKEAFACASTETTAGGHRGIAFELHLSFTGPDEGVVRVVRPDGEWSFDGQQRFVLLYLLGRAGGGWVDDVDLKMQLWGRAGLYDMDRSALHKLIHDVRQLFRVQKIGGWIIEKKRGKTRLALDAGRIHIVEDSEDETS